MAKYNVIIIETLERVVEVEAESVEDAKYIVKKQWRRGEHVLDSGDFTDVEFDVEENNYSKGD